MGKFENHTDEARYFEGVGTFVDENGEVFIKAPAATHKVVNLRQAEAFKAEQEADKWRKGRQQIFTNSNMRNLHEVYGVLTTAQCGYLMLLQCYISFDGGVLVNEDRQKTPMTKRQMMETLQLAKKPRSFYDFYRACVDNGIIIEKDDGLFAMNERYHFQGAFNNPYVVRSYVTRIRRGYREVKASDIGLIYRMLPFVHFETNALCANPYERNPRAISWFNRKELAEAIGVNPDTLGRRLPKITMDGEYIVARIKVGSEPERYTFNPSVVYRGKREPDKTLQAMFNVKAKK